MDHLEKVMTGIFKGIELAKRSARQMDFTELDPIEFDDDFIEKLPDRPAVYFILNGQMKPVYIGKAVSLRARWKWSRHHCLERAREDPESRLAWVEIVPAYLMILESLFIMVFKPAWNQREYVDDGAYMFPNDPSIFVGAWSKD